MKNIKIILPNIIICIVISLVAIILPVEIKNTTSFIYNLICFIVFNIIGCFVNNSLIENNLKKDLNNTPVFYLYIIFNILLAILLFISKVVNITINISIILTLILFTIYFLFILSDSCFFAEHCKASVLFLIFTPFSCKIRFKVFLSW